MKKRFKSKNIKKRFKLKNALLFIILVLITYLLSFNYIYKKITKNISQIEMINILLEDEKDFKKVFSNNGISFLVNYALGLNIKKESPKKELPVIRQEDINKENKPVIYIYNTHQTEEYKKINNNTYNIAPTVLHASLIFQSKLKKLGIDSIVEKNNIKEILDINSWNYRNSYKASKMLAQKVLEENPDIKYVVDIHRDSIPESISTLRIDNVSYAKMMIVLGTGHDGYEYNLEFSNRINNYLKEFNEGLTRGIDIKNHSGIFNQDLSTNAILIEVGGQNNDILSVSNSLEVLANVYKKVIDEDNEKKEI